MRRGCGRSLRAAGWTLLAAVLIAMSGGGCASRMGLIAAGPNGQGFLDQRTGRRFIPFGTNYYDPNTGWPPKVWQRFDPERVARQFEVMRMLGVNCARVFLAAKTFQPEVDTIDPDALAKLDQLVRIARKTGIRLILAGPDHWEGSPDYWQPDRFAGDKALRALDNFWTVVAGRYRGEPAIFAWDLLNEPSIPWFVEGWQPRWNAWLQAKYADRDGLKAAWGDELGDQETLGAVGVPENVAKQGNPRLLDWQLFREHLADEWVRRQVETIRAVDPTHPITVGYIQWSYPVVRAGDPDLYSAFNPHHQSKWLDFISIHFYPLMGRPYGSRANWEQNLAYLQTVLAYCHTGLPVVLEEYGWYGGGAPKDRPLLNQEQQATWLTAEIEASRRLAHGWLSWPFADTPESEDMSVYGGMVTPEMIPKQWGFRFRDVASNLSTLPQPAPPLPAYDCRPSLTTPVNDLPAMYAAHSQLVQAALRQAGPVPPLLKEQAPQPDEATP